jgi:hypothetical protein
LNFPKTFAQFEAALPFLYENPSPELTGLGWTGVSLPNDNPLGFYYNPANLGFFAQENNLSIEIYPGTVQRQVSVLINELNSYGINTGYNFQKELNGINFSVGAGFIHSSFEYELRFLGQQDSYNAFGLGASIDYYVLFSAGLTYKTVHSEFSSVVAPVLNNADVDANAVDYGFLLTLPFMRLFNVNSIALNDEMQLNPIVNYSLGYSRLNIGDEIYYVDPAQSDPLPLTARFLRPTIF